MHNLVVITDFDGTLMEQDVGDVLMEQLGVLEQPESLKASAGYKNKEFGSMVWAQTNYAFLKHKKTEVDEILQHIQPRRGAQAFIQFCREHNIGVTVLSDGMEYYIQQLLMMHAMEVDAVIANPIRYLDNGSYQLHFQNSNSACRWCGCCKADVVRAKKRAGLQVIYIGDGTSDFYGSSFADWVFARGALAKHLDQAKSPYYPFETFQQVLEIMHKDWPQFLEGTATRKMKNANTFCKFPD
jgi:2-hydroxy-3-keto-5-methylthiopentenyl-1-phosphate phosphatase